MKHPARDADVRGKADLVERAGCRLPAGRLAGHREKQPTSLLVEQQHGAALGPEQLAYPLRRVAEAVVATILRSLRNVRTRTSGSGTSG